MVAASNTLNIYTYGSEEDGVVAGLFCSKLGIRRPFKLLDHCSIFQAKGFIIGKVAELASQKITAESGQPNSNQANKVVSHIGQKYLK